MTDGESGNAAVFSGLVAGIAATAMGMLQQTGALIDGNAAGGAPDGADAGAEAGSPEQRADAIRTGLANARQYIDTLAVLQQKTKGNLTQNEEQLVSSVLADLKIAFVKVNDRWKASSTR